MLIMPLTYFYCAKTYINRFIENYLLIIAN